MAKLPKKVYTSAKGASRITLSVDRDTAEKVEKLAALEYGGNVSATVNDILRQHLSEDGGPMSPLIKYTRTITRIFDDLQIHASSPENAVHWILSELGVGIEAKLKYADGKAETGLVSAMAYSVGAKLCGEIWIVCADTMTDADYAKWGAFTENFKLCTTKAIRHKYLREELLKAEIIKDDELLMDMHIKEAELERGGLSEEEYAKEMEDAAERASTPEALKEQAEALREHLKAQDQQDVDDYWKGRVAEREKQIADWKKKSGKKSMASANPLKLPLDKK